MDRQRVQIDVRRLKRAVYGPIIGAFSVLIFLTWMDETLDMPFLIYRTSQTASPWMEALEETLLIITVACFTLAVLRSRLNRLINGKR